MRFLSITFVVATALMAAGCPVFVTGEDSAAPPLTGRRDPLVKKAMAREELKVIFTQLAHPEAYVFPAYPRDSMGIVTFPVPPRAESQVTEGVTGGIYTTNAVKDLGILEDEAPGILTTEIESTLAVYLRLYQEQTDRVKANIAAANLPPETPAGFSVQATRNADGAPTIAGMRGKTLALMTCVAALEMDACRPSVLKIVTEARKQYAESKALYEDETNPQLKGFGYINLIQASLYNRQLLSTAMLACVKDKVKRAEIIANTGVKCDDERYGGRGPVTIPYCDEVTDDQFEGIALAAFPELAQR